MSEINNSFFSRLKKYVLKRLQILHIEEELRNQLWQIRELQAAMAGTISESYKMESDYIRINGLSFFPYKVIKNVPYFDSGYDEDLKLPYVCHKRKKLYFPHSYSLNECTEMYKSYIGEECLLGGQYRENQPHQYITESFSVEEGDVLVDVGCAEALLSLDNIEIVSKVYLFEANQEWMPALKATFKEYMDKVVIINKFVSDKDSDHAITLKTALKNERAKSLFIKMDIEGAEVEVLNGSRDYLTKRNKVKIACCTYHKQNDAENVTRILSEMGYSYEFSDGYMFVYDDANIKYPYFRKGLVRARKD